MSNLLTRLKEATGPDRELDKKIWLKLVPGTTRKTTHVDHWKKPYDIDETRDASGVLVVVPSYTASLDAVLGLIGEVLPGWSYHLDSPSMNAMGDTLPARAQLREVVDGDFGKTWIKRADGSSHCMILAALIALLTAMGELEDA